LRGFNSFLTGLLRDGPFAHDRHFSVIFFTTLFVFAVSPSLFLLLLVALSGVGLQATAISCGNCLVFPTAPFQHRL
jgi:hypothetical protein